MVSPYRVNCRPEVAVFACLSGENMNQSVDLLIDASVLAGCVCRYQRPCRHGRWLNIRR